ncbi:MAG: TIM barrel protein [Candidatus Anstonellales archaeon]
MRFGPAGIPIECKEKNTKAGIMFTASLCLNAMEMEFVRGVSLTEKAALEAKKAALERDVLLSSHAPYYINLCTKDSKKLERSKRNILISAKRTAQAGGKITVFHPGYYQGLEKEEAFQKAKKALVEIKESMDKEGVECMLGAETVGKRSQFGSLEENIRLGQEVEGVVPVVDFAHIQARGDMQLIKKEQFHALFERLEKVGFAKNFHSHFSEIEYSEKGERNHLVLGTNYVPDYRELAKELAEGGWKGTVICESPLLEQDALKLKSKYESEIKGGRK